MPNLPTYHFNKSDRLKSRKQIQALFEKGRGFTIPPFRVIWMPGDAHSVLQAGVSVSSRNFKRAVDRNRIKRLMREAYRLQKNSLYDVLIESGQHMSVFFIYTGKVIPIYQDVYQHMTAIIHRLKKQIHATGQANP